MFYCYDFKFIHVESQLPYSGFCFFQNFWLTVLSTVWLLVCCSVVLCQSVCRLSVTLCIVAKWYSVGGLAMVPLDKALVSAYTRRLSIVTMSLSASVWPQFATQCPCASVFVETVSCLFTDTGSSTAGNMTAEGGAWRGLRYDIMGIKRRRDDSSERTHPDATRVDGYVLVRSEIKD